MGCNELDDIRLVELGLARGTIITTNSAENKEVNHRKWKIILITIL
jgi:hypothetical protein